MNALEELVLHQEILGDVKIFERDIRAHESEINFSVKTLLRIELKYISEMVRQTFDTLIVYYKSLMIFDQYNTKLKGV